MTGWWASTLAGTAVLTLVVLLARGPVARAFGSRAAYALWLAPALRMVLPPAELLPPISPAGPGGALWVAIVVEPASKAAQALPSWLVPLWLGGAGLYLAARLVAHHLFLARALAEGEPLDRPDFAYDLVATPTVDGPLATGLLHRLVLVPADFEARFTHEQQRLALRHEALHHERGDLWACAAALVAVALNWFNPLAHIALGAFRRDMESACDAQLLAGESAETVPAYAETLLRCAARPVPRSLCALTSIDELKGRLMMLTNTPPKFRRIAGLAVAGALAAGGLMVSLPASAQDSPEKQQVRKEVRIVEVNGEDGKKYKIESERADLKRECPGELTAVTDDASTESADKKQKTFIMICTKKGEGNAETVKGLRDAIGRLDSSSEMDPAMKAELKAKLQARIDELSKK
jgi:beta-lactamase regulating signal transducer with metallopeptidase domain